MDEPILLMPDAAPAAGGALHDRLECELRGARLSLPVMPEVALRVRRQAADPQTGAAAIAAIIATDPGLSARILRLSNSALYGGLSPVRDLAQAIARLGPRMVLTVVLAAARRDAFRSDDPGLDALLEGAWMAALHGAAAGRLLAPRLAIDAEEGSLAGLLLPSGIPVLAECVSRLVREGAIDPPSAAALREALHALSPAAGAALLARWEMPPVVRNATEYQLTPDAAPVPARPAAWLGAALAAAGPGLAAGEPLDALAAWVAGALRDGPVRWSDDELSALLEHAADDARALVACL